MIELSRTDHRVTTQDGIGLRVRSVEPSRGAGEVVVLVHGIAAPLVPTYDLGVAGYSFLDELANRGYRAVAFDHRNFGASDRIPAMNREPEPDPHGHGMQTLDDSVEDIRAVVLDACARYKVPRVTLFGSSRGAIQVLAFAATEGADRLSLAILNNPSSLCYLSGAASGTALEAYRDERRAAARTHNYTPYTAEFQRKRWQKLFGDKQTTDAALQEAYIAACIQSDQEGSQRTPQVFRVPTESFPDRVPLIALERVQVPLLVIEAEEVPEQHTAAFFSSLGTTGNARLVHIRDSNHFTLRNPRRFELANLIDVSVTARSWR